MDASNERIEALLADLEGLGEDSGEMGYWRSLLPDLTPEQKEELAASLEAEAIGLKRAAGMPTSSGDRARVEADKAVLEAARKADIESQVRRIKESL